MSDEQKIEGVPEGWRLVGVNFHMPPGSYEPSLGRIYGEAVLERIPKPKKRVQVAEFDLRDGETLANIRATSLFHLNSPRFIDKGPRQADHIRIEERDA